MHAWVVWYIAVMYNMCITVALFFASTFSFHALFLPYIERAPIQLSSRQGQSVKIFQTCEEDERYSSLKLVDRAMLAVCSRQGRLL